jgi:antagonist of KipI
MIEVIAPGSWTTIQDRGRQGYERIGVPSGGSLDRFAAAVANRLVGNHPDAALLECTLTASSLRFSAPALIAITGGVCARLVGWRTHAISADQTIDPGSIRPGIRVYLAVRGGIDVQPLMGSRSLCQRGGFGGGFGRSLRAGDHLPVGEMIAGDPKEDEWPSAHRLPMQGPWEVRIMAGPHDDAFPPAALERLLNTACRITPHADRIGMRLETPGVHLRGGEILTTAVPEGGIQVTPSGGLIVLLAEHQTTGGYPIIATVIDADLPLLAQARPGDTIHFRLVNEEEAARARARLNGWLA